MIWKDEKFAAHKRNKGGDYTNTVSRGDLEQEIRAIFASQRRLGNTCACEEMEKEFLEIFERQLPFALGDSIEQNVGNCTFEPDCKRAPKAAWTVERFMLLSRIVNLRLRFMGRKHEFSADEVHVIAQLAYDRTKVLYRHIREALSLDSDYAFADLPVNRKDPGKDPEENTFIELKAFHQFRRAVTKALGKAYWEDLMSRDPQVYDQACVLAGYSHSNPDSKAERYQLLPVLSNEEIRNPVVFRALTQTRKAVNAIIRKYGAPEEIYVELSRDLGKSREERNKVIRRQDQNRNEQERASEHFYSLFSRTPSSTDLLKFRLWKEQGGKCAYSLKHIDAELAFGGLMHRTLRSITLFLTAFRLTTDTTTRFLSSAAKTAIRRIRRHTSILAQTRTNGTNSSPGLTLPINTTREKRRP